MAIVLHFVTSFWKESKSQQCYFKTSTLGDRAESNLVPIDIKDRWRKGKLIGSLQVWEFFINGKGAVLFLGKARWVPCQNYVFLKFQEMLYWKIQQ